MTGDGRERPQRTPPFCYQSKYHCYIATFEIIIFGVWKHSTCSCSTGSSREDRHPPLPLFFVLFLLLEVLPTCVIVWPLSACLLQSAVLQQPSPPPSISLARSLPPCGPLQTDSPLLPSPSPPKSSSFRTGPPPCIESTTLLLLYYYCYTRVCPQQPPLPLSLPVSLLQGSLYPETESTDILFYCIFPFFFFFFYWSCWCAF